MRGAFIAAPYHDVKVTDPDKLAAMTQAYVDWRSGKRSELPDIREVFLDAGLREMSFAPASALDGRGLLVQLCQQCHNKRLDPTISRERFLVDDLASMSRVERDLAIERLGLDHDSRLLMPPLLFHTITDEERSRVVSALRD